MQLTLMLPSAQTEPTTTSSSMATTATATAMPRHVRDGSCTASTSGRLACNQTVQAGWHRSLARPWRPAGLLTHAQRLRCSGSSGISSSCAAGISLQEPSLATQPPPLAASKHGAPTALPLDQQSGRGHAQSALPSQHVLDCSGGGSSACDVVLPSTPLSAGIQLLHAGQQAKGSAAAAGFASALEVIGSSSRDSLADLRVSSPQVVAVETQQQVSGAAWHRLPASSSTASVSSALPSTPLAGHKGPEEQADDDAHSQEAARCSPAAAGRRPVSTRVANEMSWEWQATPMLSPASPHEPSALDPPPPASPPPRAASPWLTEPRVLSALLLRSQRLGRYERLIEQFGEFFNHRHVAIALSLLPTVADLSRTADEFETSSERQEWLRQQWQHGKIANGQPASSDDEGESGSSSSEAAADLQALEEQQRQQQQQLEQGWRQLMLQQKEAQRRLLQQRKGPVQVGLCYPVGRQHTYISRARRVRVRNLANRLAQGFLRFLRQGEYGPHDFAIAVWSLARVGYRPSATWQSAVLRACHQSLPLYEPQQLSYMLWGVASLGLDPGLPWLRAAQAQVLARAQAGQLDSAQTAVCFWSIAKLAAQASSVSSGASGALGQGPGRQPGAELGAGTASPTSSRGGGEEDSDGSDAEEAQRPGQGQGLGRTQRPVLTPSPRPAWAPRPGGGTRSLSMVAAAAAPLPAGVGVPAPAPLAPGWVEAYLSAAMPLLHGFESRHLCMTLTALVQLQQPPPDTFLQPLLQLSLQRTLSAGAAASLLWSLARLHRRPSKAWLQALTPRLGALLPEMGCQELSMSLWALAALQAEPQEELLQQYEAETHSRLEEFSAQQLAVMVWAMARLGFRPHAMWMDKVAKVRVERGCVCYMAVTWLLCAFMCVCIMAAGKVTGLHQSGGACTRFCSGPAELCCAAPPAWNTKLCKQKQG